jgi:hypothetical protein
MTDNAAPTEKRTRNVRAPKVRVLEDLQAALDKVTPFLEQRYASLGEEACNALSSASTFLSIAKEYASKLADDWKPLVGAIRQPSAESLVKLREKQAALAARIAEMEKKIAG